jgi:hypothetical protein
MPDKETQKFTIKCATADNQDIEQYTVYLNPEQTLSKLRADLQAQLDLPQRWAYVQDGSQLAASAETVTKVSGLAGDKQTFDLRLLKDKGPVEGTPAEAVKEQLKELGEQLSAVKRAIIRSKDGLLSREDREALELPAHPGEDRGKWGGDTGKSCRELSEHTLADIVRSLCLPRTARREPDGSFAMTEFVARLKPLKNSDPVKTLVQQYLVAANEVETRVEKFTEAWQKRSFEVGFMNISAALQLSFPTFGGRFGASASYERSEQTEQSSQDGGSTLYIVGSQEVRKARVFVPLSMIALDDHVQKRFVDATKLAELGDGQNAQQPEQDGDAQRQEGPAEVTREEQIVKNLEPLFNEYGYFVVTEYVLGAKLTTYDELKAKDRTSSEAKAVEQQIAAALSYKHAQGGADGSGGHGYSDSGKGTHKEASERLAFRLQAKGGSATDRYDPQAWVKSIGPANWEVIAYGRLVPIYEFIEDENVRELCRKAQEQLNERLFNKAVELWATNSSRTPGTGGAQELSPDHEGWHNRQLKDHKLVAHTNWVRVPAGQYFRGAQLKVQGNRLTLTLITVDKYMRLLPDVDTDVKQDIKVDEETHVQKSLTAGSGLFFDTTPVPIPPGHRITALRLRKLNSPSNRIGIEVETVEGVPQVVGTERKLWHHGDNQSYVNKDMGDIYLSAARTVAPKDRCIVGIHLADLGSHNTLGIRLLTRPAEE